MIIKVEGQIVRLEPKTESFIKMLSERNGTPANEVVSAIINGHMGRLNG